MLFWNRGRDKLLKDLRTAEVNFNAAVAAQMPLPQIIGKGTIYSDRLQSYWQYLVHAHVPVEMMQKLKRCPSCGQRCPGVESCVE